MSIEKAKPIIDATQNAFMMFFQQELIPGRPYLFQEGEDDKSWDLIVQIGLSGSDKGSVHISLTTELVQYLMKHIVAEAGATGSREDVEDVFMEVLNVIAGNAKKEYEDMFEDPDQRLYITLPNAVSGNDLKNKYHETGTMITVPFTCNGGQLFLTFGFVKLIVGL
jgi:CheY-specific phosphatase CheX